jgi:hypothetical protein
VRYHGQDDDSEAARKWKSWNAYLALFVVNPGARATPIFSNLSKLGTSNLATTLETSSDRWNFHKELWLPAAAEWMRIAGDEIEKICRSGEQKCRVGDLWEAEGGEEICDMRRFEFWRKRLAEEGL